MAFRSKVIKFGTAAVTGPVLTARMSNQIDYSRGHILLCVPRQLERPSERTYRAPLEFTAHSPSGINRSSSIEHEPKITHENAYVDRQLNLWLTLRLDLDFDIEV